MIGEVSLSRNLKDIPDVSKVQGRLKINDVLIDWLSFDINSTNTHAADTFTIEAPYSDQTIKPMVEILATDSLKVEIIVNDGTGAFVRILLGYVDDYEIDLIDGIVSFAGRDLTSLLMDKKALRSNVIADITASDLAGDYAEEHELKKDITATTLLIGEYDTEHHVLVTGSQSEWDVLCKVAQNENYDVYIIDDTLYFKPQSVTKKYYNINWSYITDTGFPSSNVLKIKVGRNLTIANDISVQVKGWNGLNAAKYSQTVSRKHTPHRVKGRSKTQRYVVYADGVDPDAATSLAESYLLKLSQHEKKLILELMGDTILNIRSILKLTGVGNNYDQLYYPASIRRHMSFGDPFLMDVLAKNHDVNSQVV